MNFKNLNLDRDKIYSAIKTNYPQANTQMKKKGNAIHIEINYDGVKALLIIYHNNDGTTSINPNVGKQQEVSNKIAQIIVSMCLLDDRKYFDLSLKDIDSVDYGNLIKYLIEDSDLGVSLCNEEKNEKYLRVTLKSKYDDSLYIKYYTNGTLQLQGKPLHLYNDARLFLCVRLSLDDVINHQSKRYKVAIKPSDIRYELQALLTYAYGFLDEQIIKMLACAISLKKISLDIEDYSFLAYSAIRALEGYIKQLFLNRGIQINKDGFTTEIFSWVISTHTLTKKIREKIGCDKTCNAIETCYSYYNKHRHTLFHTEGIPSTTRLIESQSDADRIVDKVIELIEQTYESIL